VPPRSAAGLRRYWLFTGGLLVLFLALFALVEGSGVAVLRDPGPWLAAGGPGAAALAVGLLVADVVLPIPSSLVMVADGALFGVVLGTALSLAGSLGASLLGFFIGRRSQRWIARLVTPAEKARADVLLGQWGALAVVLTRPLPLLAETVAVLAGASPMGWGRMTVASVLGALPPCLLYAVAGATSRRLETGLWVFLGVVAAAGIFYWLGRRASRSV